MEDEAECCTNFEYWSQHANDGVMVIKTDDVNYLNIICGIK